MAQLTQHGTKVQKNGSEMDSWYEWVERHSERPTPLYEAEESKTVSFGLQVSHCTDIRYVPRSSLRLVVFFHYPILSEVVAALFTEQVPRLISLEDLPLGGIARIVMCLLSFSF